MFSLRCCVFPVGCQCLLFLPVGSYISVQAGSAETEVVKVNLNRPKCFRRGEQDQITGVVHLFYQLCGQFWNNFVSSHQHLPLSATGRLQFTFFTLHTATGFVVCVFGSLGCTCLTEKVERTRKKQWKRSL